MEPRFSIIVTNYQWSCGDGCCSDSGYKLAVWDNFGPSLILDDEDWEFNRNEETRIEQGINAIKKTLGKVPVLYEDYLVYKGNETSENSY